MAARIAPRCEIQIAYAIGVREPVSIMVNTFETGEVSDEQIVSGLVKVFDFTPQGIIKHLDLLRPIYQKTAAYGHFGRMDNDFTWERTDAVDRLRDAILKAVAV